MTPLTRHNTYRTTLTIALGWACATFLLLSLFASSPARAGAQADPPILGVLHSGQRPEALAIDLQTHMLYIAHESPGTVVGFDPISGTVRWRSTLGSTVTDVQVDSSTHRVYAAAITYSSRQSNLFLLDGTTGHTLATLPAGFGDNSIAFDSKRHRVYVATPEAGIVTMFSLDERGALQGRPVRQHIGSRPVGVAVNSRLSRLYIADSSANSITVLDEDTGRRLATIAVAAYPLPPLRVDEASGRLYVVCSNGQELDVIDGKTNTVIAHPQAAPYPEGIAFRTATGRIYVADEGNQESGTSDRGSGDTVTVIDGQSFEVLGTLRVGSAPDGVEADPALHRVYIALEDSNVVMEITDSQNLALKSDGTRQAIMAQQTIVLLRQATLGTLVLMLVTIMAATLLSLLPRWRARETPQTGRGGGPSRSGPRSLAGSGKRGPSA